jgi:hypothetical protein
MLFILLAVAFGPLSLPQLSPAGGAVVFADAPPGAPAGGEVDPAPTLVARWVDGRPPRLDGQLDEEVWNDAQVARNFVQSEPAPGEPATEGTEVRVLVSGDALYIGARLHDRNPDGVHGPLARRDEDIPSDWFFVYLDANRDRTTVTAFAVNPRGVKRDFLIGADGREDPDWQAIWEVTTSVDSLGWVVEMRIPLSQLRFGGGAHDGASPHWGVNFERRLARRGEVSGWVQLPRNRRQIVNSLGELSGLEGVSSPLRLEVVPYSLARVTDTGEPGSEASRLFGTLGANMRVGLPGSLTLSAAFNPDFGQVEADPAVVNVSGYRTFFPEKRPFFLEDQEFFTHEIGRTRIFHSRRIGRDVDPGPHTRSSLQRVPDASGILASSKVSGRSPGGWSIGLLHAVTNSEARVTIDSVGVETFDPVEPRTNYFVGQVGRERRLGNEVVGGIFTLTHRGLSGDLVQDLPSRAIVGGGTWYRRSDDGTTHFSSALLASHVAGHPEVIRELQGAHGRYLDRPDASHLHLDPNREQMTGFGGELSLDRIGDGNWSWGAGGQLHSPGFEVNDLGYQREADVGHQYAYVGWDRLGEGFLLRRRRLTLTQWSDWTFGGERTGTGGRVDLQLQFRNLWGIVTQVEGHLPHLDPDQLRGGPALRMGGSWRHRAVLYTDPRRSFTVRLDGSRLVDRDTGGILQVLRGTFGARPARVALLTLEPSMVERVGSLEYLTRRTTTGGDVFVFGEMSQRTVSLVSRLDLALSPTFSLQFYAQPYLVTRTVRGLREVADPRASILDERFRMYTPAQVDHDVEGERYYVDRTGDGQYDFSFPDPAFTYGQLSSNLVLRWEYRPASTLYLVWSHDFRDRTGSAGLDPLEGMADLLGLRGRRGAPSTNVLLLKITYWLSS